MRKNAAAWTKYNYKFSKYPFGCKTKLQFFHVLQLF